MQNYLNQNWWVLFFRGCIAVVFGILAIFYPLRTLSSLVLLFGVYALINGGFAAYDVISEYRRNKNWRWTLADGIISLFVGIAAWLLVPLFNIASLVLVAIYAIVTGVVQFVVGWRLIHTMSLGWLLSVSGVVSIIVGALLLLNPTANLFIISVIVGIYAIVFGLMLMKTALNYRKLKVYPHENDYGLFDTEPLPSSM